ncbi:uncharacterized protein LY89DRAFT_380755 [Mollisia scopiformis]|uniref:Uncharacterized protein n=1 Tax=Mollisia scopiformis TaxID=149040 RepID=A0A194XNH9_MOLSC|nr:uncharacterized protein LY89DRAFT_380755 [Mollisia scopiformis]KUJ21706.1 hypothetical protein LY89DRAFT_380755 [Mollisia scopiformis]
MIRFPQASVRVRVQLIQVRLIQHARKVSDVGGTWWTCCRLRYWCDNLWRSSVVIPPCRHATKGADEVDLKKECEGEKSGGHPCAVITGQKQIDLQRRAEWIWVSGRTSLSTPTKDDQWLLLSILDSAGSDQWSSSGKAISRIGPDIQIFEISVSSTEVRNGETSNEEPSIYHSVCPHTRAAKLTIATDSDRRSSCSNTTDGKQCRGIE